MHACLLQDWITQHKKRGIQPVISNPSRQVMHLLEKAGIPELIGEEYITVRVNDAVLMCQVSARPALRAAPSLPCCQHVSACTAGFLRLHEAVQGLGVSLHDRVAWKGVILSRVAAGVPALLLTLVLVNDNVSGHPSRRCWRSWARTGRASRSSWSARA